jgi:hypothetical protein
MKYICGILILAVATSGLAFDQRSLTMTRDQVKIFCLLKPNQDPQQELPELNNPLLHGLSWRFKWQTIEPQESQYNWQMIDKAIEVSSKAGKKVMLRIISGMHTPDWVYLAGAKPFDFNNTDLFHPGPYPSSMRMPIPWDAVYLAKWTGFIRAFGRRYNGNPSIYSIQMAGGGHIDEMNLPMAYAKWQQASYSDEKLIAAWKRIIDVYQTAFPNTPTNLDINEPLIPLPRRGLPGKPSNVLDPVVFYVLATYPGKVYLQQNGLKADLPSDNRIRRIIREASSKTIVGYQMVGGKGFHETQTGDRMTAFRNALEDRVSYVEVYASDVRDPTQQRALQFLSIQQERR